MDARTQSRREHQLASLEHRLRELEEQSATATHGMILAAARERRTSRGEELEREVLRLRGERERLERESALERSTLPEEDADRHITAIEHQLRQVLGERDRWFRESLDGRRRRQEDFRQLQRLKEENERLTSELLRCAAMLSGPAGPGSQRMRRVLQALRLSGV